jgi:hypothetical protein
MVDGDEQDREELEDQIIGKFDEAFGGTYDWDQWGARDDFIQSLDHLSTDTLAFMADSTADEIEDWANYGFEEGMEEPPEWLLEMGWYDDDGDWHNPFGTTGSNMGNEDKEFRYINFQTQLEIWLVATKLNRGMTWQNLISKQ